jgi:hypothetical protein
MKANSKSYKVVMTYLILTAYCHEDQAKEFLRIIVGPVANFIDKWLREYESLAAHKIKEVVKDTRQLERAVSSMGSHFDLDSIDPESYFSSLVIPKIDRMFGVSSKR